MDQDSETILPFASISRRKLEADFKGGEITSDGGALFLREVEKGIGVVGSFALALKDRRDARYVNHPLEERNC